MDRSKRQELVEKAIRSFKDPLLPEEAWSKQGMPYEYVNGRKQHPWKNHLPLFVGPVATPIFDQWKNAKAAWQKQKPSERKHRFFPELKLQRVRKVKGDAVDTDPDNSNGGGGAGTSYGSNVIQPSSSSSAPTNGGKIHRLTHGSLKVHSSQSRKAWLKAEGNRLGLTGFQFKWHQSEGAGKSGKSKMVDPTTSSSASRSTKPPATSSGMTTSKEATVVRAELATSSTTLTATRTTATMTTKPKRKIGGVGNMSVWKFIERCAQVGIDQAGKEANIKSSSSTGDFEMKYIYVMPPEFHQWNAQRKAQREAFENLSPAEKRRRLRKNRDGYEDGGSWVTAKSMVGDMPWEEETQPFSEVNDPTDFQFTGR